MAANFPTSLPSIYTPVSGQSLLDAGHMDSLHEQDRLEIRAMGNELGLTADDGTLLPYIRLHDGTSEGLWVPAHVLSEHPIINPNFRIWQAGTSQTSIATNTWLADGFKYAKSGAMVHDAARSSDIPTITGQHPYMNYTMLIDCTTVDSSIAAGDYCYVEHRAEGFLWVPYAQREWTLGFWHKHTKVGTYCVALVNSGGDRSCVQEYTQAVTNTWEYSTVTFPASPSAGTWSYTTGVGVRIVFTLAAGSTYQTTAGAWQTGEFYATSNQVNACDDTANNFRIGALQPALGPIAIPFHPRPFRLEEMLAQRYVWKNTPLDTSPLVNGSAVAYVLSAKASTNIVNGEYYIDVTLPQEMRSSPTVTTWPYTTATNTGRSSDGGGGDYGASSAVFAGGTSKKITIQNQSGGSLAVSANGVVHVGIIAVSRP